MFRDFFGIDQNPFSNTPDPNFLFMSDRHKEALAHLIYGVEGNSGFVLLTGEVGTGKTTLCRYLAEQVPDNVELALCINPRLTETELLDSICDDMGIAVPGDRYSAKHLTDCINAHLLDVHAKGGRAVLIIDEAQNLGLNRLEQVRLLTNLETADTKLLQIILIGQPELRDLISKPEARQLSQRITARYHLDPMTPREVESYIGHRLGVAGLPPQVFKPAAIRIVNDNSRGIPRLINSICERCLLGAYVAGSKTVDGKLALAAAREVLGDASPPRRPVVRASVGIAASLLFAAVLILDPLGLNLMPGISNSPQVSSVRAEIRTWPGFSWLDQIVSNDPDKSSPCPEPSGEAARGNDRNSACR